MRARLAAPGTLLLGSLALLAGCASSTAPGTVGVGRPQLLTVAPTEVSAQASSGYRRLSSAAGSGGRLNSDGALTTRVRTIARRLIAEVGVFRPDALGWRWEVNVFDSPQVNAFCVPGGKIGVFTGLVHRLDLSDDELAAVLGHEIAHALREHTREQMSQRSLSNSIVELIAHSGLPYAAPAAILASLGSTHLVRMPFSHQMELEADLMGIELMARAGYDPRRAPGLWRKLQREEETAGATEFLRTHPTHDRRISEIERVTPRVMTVYRPGALLVPVTSEPAPDASPARAPPATFPRVAASPLRTGQDEYQVRRAAQAEACVAPRATLIGQAPATEVYGVACEGGPERRYVCQFGHCAAR
ncbi:MAG TPA: M48 family metallopeptidase [Caldimonas sp.]|jgi:predicted Zn-dependent protease|nr:M48 family metallopeptidase [Caldimonas sp.]